tara:strand:- start:2659 stop:5385 length:2727 start_codon:yes stop_codon:yes gene_type:complete
MANIKGKQLSGNLAVTNVTASGHISGSNTSTGSFGNVQVVRSMTAANVSASVIQANQGTIDIHSLSGYVANENIDHTSVTLTAGDGLSGGGTIAANRSFAVDSTVLRTTGDNVVSSSAQIASNISGSFTAPSASFSTRVTTAESELSNTLFSSSAQVDHDSTTNFVANEHIDHTSVSITAGAGLTGGGTIASTRDIAVGAGTGVTVNANDVAIGQAVSTTSNVKFANITGSNISGSSLLGVVGTATQGTIDIHSLSGYVANENIDHTSVTITAGAGLTGGGTIAATRTLAVGAGTGVTVNANDVAIGQAVAASSTPTFAGLTLTGNLISDSIISGSRVATLGAITGSTISASILIGTQITGSEISASVAQATQGTIDIHSLSGYVANENIDHTSVSVIAGTGLTGGGTIAANRTLNVIGGDGITANANDIAITAAQTTITSLLATDIKIGEDDQTKIDFETPNEIHFYADNTEQVYLGDNIFGPESDSDVDLGATGVRWKDAFVDSVTATGNVAAATITATGDITTEGDVIAKNYIVSSSVTHMTQSFLSGSTIFGDDTLDTHIFTGSLLITGSAPTDITTTNSIFVGNDITGSIISGSSLLGVVGTATQGTIDHDSLANFVADEHVAHGDVSIIAGAGLTGGGTIAANRTINVVGGTGITANANEITTTDGEIVHDSLSGFVANEHIDHSGVSVTAGTGLTGGGTIAATRTLNVIGGDGITANANDIAITAAQTTITSLINSSLTKIGTATDQEYIKFDTSNEVNTHINNTERLSVTAVGVEITGHVSASGNITGSIIEASGDVIAFGSSDRRLKDNITPIENPLEKMDKIGGYTFVWNDNQSTYTGKDVGVVAQEIEEILPELVTTRGTGYKAVKYEKIVPLLIESIKELQKKVQKIEENCDCLNK